MLILGILNLKTLNGSVSLANDNQIF